MSPELAELAAAMVLGRFPSWPAHALIAAGEELRDVLRDDLPQAETDRSELERIEQTLVDFGALAEGDRVTGLADLIDALLPPREG